MNILDELSEMGLKDKHFLHKTEFLIDEFLPKNLITLYWAEGGNGKSFLSQAVTKYLLDANSITQAYYFDLDNPINVLKDRNVSELLVSNHPMLSYIHRSRIKVDGEDLLFMLERGAVGDAYKGCIFVFDSLRNFVDVQNDGRVMRAMDALMNIREAGATILLLSHANKDGKNYQGSNNIKNSIDCMYKLRKTYNDDVRIDFVLEVQKERAGIVNSAWRVDTDTLTLTRKEYKTAAMTEYDKLFTQKVKEALQKHPEGLNKTALLEYVGHKKDDRTARDALERYEGDLWDAKKVSNVFTYTLKDQQLLQLV